MQLGKEAQKDLIFPIICSFSLGSADFVLPSFFFFNVHFVFCIFVLLSFLLHADLLKKHRVFFVYRNEQNALEIQSPS